MQLCEEVAEGLFNRGHEVVILTSTHTKSEEIKRKYPVYRDLTIDPNWNCRRSAGQQFFFGRRGRERRALNDFKRVVDDHQPELIFIWHAIGLPKSLLKEAENSNKSEAVYYLADYQPEIGDEYIAYWTAKSRKLIVRLLKTPFSKVALAMLENEGKPIKLGYSNVICVSQYVRDRLVSGGFIPNTAIVIHNGVDLIEFTPRDEGKLDSWGDHIRCLVAGRIIPNKGVHTVVDAFALLDLDSLPGKVTLTILGDGPEDYVRKIKSKINRYGLDDIIKIKSPIPRSKMPDLLSWHDVLILSSEYDEPLARSIQEAMAMEMLVIGTTTGGSGELLVHESTGLVFEPRNAKSLAEQITLAAQNPKLMNEIRIAGREEIEHNFSIQKTVLEIESYLLDVLTRRKDREI